MYTSKYLKTDSSLSTSSYYPQHTAVNSSQNVFNNTLVDYESAQALASKLFDYYNSNSNSHSLSTSDAQKVIDDVKDITSPDTLNVSDFSNSNGNTRKEAEQFLKHHDRDLDGELTKKDFVECCIQYLCGPGGSGVNLFNKISPREELLRVLYGQLGENEVEKELLKARSVFERYDTNQDGYLDRNEVRVMMRDTYDNLRDNISLTDDAVDKYFSMIKPQTLEMIKQSEYEMFVLKALKSRNINN